MNDDLRYIPVAEYVIGCCYYGQHGNPFKTVIVRADSLGFAMSEGIKLLNPSTVQSICHIETRPNPEHIEYMNYRRLLCYSK